MGLHGHFAEEIEHKSVAHDTLMSVENSYFNRVLGGLIAFGAFHILLLFGTVYFLFCARKLWSYRNIEGVLFLVKSGFISFIGHQTLRYFHRDFDPWEMPDYDLFLEYSELQGTGRPDAIKFRNSIGSNSVSLNSKRMVV